LRIVRRECYGLILVWLVMAGLGFAAAQESEIRTPAAPATPQINGPRVYGARPGHPFLYRIPCTGVRPMYFSAAGLPATMKLDATTGIISGESPARRGDYIVTLKADNAKGKTSRALKIVVGETLGLTPQMGWNDWYTYYSAVTDADIRTAAKAMISSGMSDYGYQFIDIDDAWMRKPNASAPELGGATRDGHGDILTNARFPDMNSLTGFVHSLGLRAGIYTSPGRTTCAGFEGSYGHEAADAARFAGWGFDLLKYDWCSYGAFAADKSTAEFMKPYIKMGALLQQSSRDMILNLCQYGNGEVWRWAKTIGGNSWRTTGDLGAAKDTSLPGFYSIGFVNAALDEYAGPGGWNDPDYLILGPATNGPYSKKPRKQLTAAEEYSYMSMWSLMASPLFFSGDMTKLDALTLSVLDNSEVIDIDQDVLGKQARIIRKTADEFVLARPLADGSMAVGLFNLRDAPGTISLDWSDVGLRGVMRVRDVWRQKDMGVIRGRLTADLGAHDVLMVRVSGK
jgi:alpha-galactosidase